MLDQATGQKRGHNMTAVDDRPAALTGKLNILGTGTITWTTDDDDSVRAAVAAYEGIARTHIVAVPAGDGTAEQIREFDPQKHLLAEAFRPPIGG